MGFLRDIWSDLVEKRLWPLAVVLVAAMVAAPVVLAGGSGGEDGAAPAPAAAPAAAPNAGDASPATPVSLDETPSQPAPGGSYRDPFAGAPKAGGAQQADPPAPPAGGGGGAPAAGEPAKDGGAPAPAGPGGSGSTPGTSTSTTPSTVTTPGSPAVQPAGVFAGYRIDLHWGRAGSAQRMTDVTRLKRLDAGDEPLLVYLGTRVSGDRALFLLATAASAVGDGRCMPAAKACQVIEMRAGESQFFDVDTGNGGVAQYELDVDRISERRADSDEAADRELAAASKLGAKAVDDAIDAGRDYVTSFFYKKSVGAIARSEKATRAWLSQATYAEVGMSGQ